MPRDTDPSSRLLAAAGALARWLRIGAMVALAAMVLIVMADVVLRISLNRLLPGSVELVQLALVVAVFLAIPETFLRDEQITVDVIDRAVSPAALSRLAVAALVATLLLLAVMSWRMIPPAIDTLIYGDLTSDLGIPFIWYWLPLIVGGLAATGVVAVRLVRRRRATAATRAAGAETPATSAGTHAG